MKPFSRFDDQQHFEKLSRKRNGSYRTPEEEAKVFMIKKFVSTWLTIKYAYRRGRER